MVGVIPAAGRGIRAYPYSKGIPKCMLEVGGEPNLARVIAIMRDQLRISDIVVIIGRYGDMIRRHFGDGSRLGVRLTYVENDAIEKGLSYSVLLSRPYVHDHFCVILGDECYVDSNHGDLLATDYRRYLATCGVMAEAFPEQVTQNYAVRVENGVIRSIIEKPADPGDALLGVGTFVFSPQIYEHLEAAVTTSEQEPNDPVSLLGRLCQRGAGVAPFYLRGHYVNINDRDQLNLANNIVRSHNFDRCTAELAVIMKGSVADTLRTVEDFRRVKRFHQLVLVVAPEAGFPREALGEDVRCVEAPSSRYGDMMRAGFDALNGDILMAVYSDGSFAPRDIPKFLEYLKDADLVIGTRTTRQLIDQGTNMRGVVRLSHVLLGKLLELVWWSYEPRFTDVGCTYRALWHSTYRLISPRLCTRGPEYSVEMLIETLRCRKRIVEIPVSFHVRHKGVKERQQTLRTFLTVVALILKRRLAALVA